MSADKFKGKQFLKAPGHFIDEATEQVEELKRRHSLAALFEGYGVKLTKSSHNGSYKGLCPWHDDHEPSLSVDETKGLYHCFGCKAKGDIIELVRKMEGLSFRDAIKKLEGGTTDGFRKPSADKKPIPRIKDKQTETTADDEPVKTAERKKPDEKDKQTETTGNAEPVKVRVVKKASKPVETAGDGAEPPPFTTTEAAPNGENPGTITLNDVAEYYHKHLYESTTAIQYLESRGITDKTLYERFQIGFSDRTLISKLSAKQKEALTTVGIVTKWNTEHFHDCIVFPVTDESGRVVGMYGRRTQIGMPTDTKQPLHLYLPGPHLGVWNRKASKVYDEIVLTESLIDALSLVQIGIEGVQPLYGKNGFTVEHL